MNKIAEKIIQIFNQGKNQHDCLNEVYKLFLPDFDNLDQLVDWPTCGNTLYRFLTQAFHVFDFEKHPELEPGRLWLQHGFLRDPNLAPWQVSLGSCRNEPALCRE